MTAAELLRELYTDGISTTFLRTPSVARVPLSLLPLLTGLVEALGDFMDPEKDDDVDANYQRVERAYAALNAAAAKEVK